ncbi:enolase C-terminal domain-like protein [Paenibacillus ginsengarvi]|uniref:L-alanine-DL-glutamate epimerase n=1 Tax=Paenibacillus ginsengarvi TaxID=400777 RepID=A0A3B0ARE4_9BACL|nr:enolase C-terminal domain-like protein [Paenibacillus ginsengarvi]RKN62874.1 L-alanine-DL-glutamate epimerase [Paenibacillus ginsengarvi]
MIRIAQAQHAVVNEPLLSPFGFKGAYLSELWQSVTLLRDDSGRSGLGAGVQSVLWSDARLFVRDGEASGNKLMADMTGHALGLIEAEPEFASPFELLERVYPGVLAFGRKSSGLSDLRSTFALNALVTVDHASWGLYARSKGQRFGELVPEEYRSALAERQSKLGSIPLIPYGMSETDIGQMLADGYFLLKIKVGADPDQDGSQDKMLEWDCRRLEQIHAIASRYETEHTVSGKIAYYLDANGRYDGKDRLLRLLDHADRIGALERIVLFEEPFPEETKIDVTDVPVRLAADESVHDTKDALERIDLGYGAMALKPVAKTMSMSLKVAKLAADKGIPCFCADLTANPLLADWNKNLAARLAPLPGLKVGVIETNGHQNYRNWERMKSWHPLAGAEWIEAQRGIYRLSETFYETNGGALEAGSRYESLFKGGQPE